VKRFFVWLEWLLWRINETVSFWLIDLDNWLRRKPWKK